MADEVTAKLVGVDELARGIGQLNEQLDRSADKALREAGERVAATARSRMPRLTGALAGGVAVTADMGGVKVGHLGGVPYAGFIEFGGHGRAYVPGGRYLFPLAEPSGPLVADACELAAKVTIERQRWPTPH